MATNIDIGTSYGNSILDKDSIKYNGLYYRHAEIKGKRLYCRFNPEMRYEEPFTSIGEIYTEGLGNSDKYEDNYVSIRLGLSERLQAEIKKPFGGTINERNYAKAPQFDSYKTDKSMYSFSVFVNNSSAEPYQYEEAAFSISLGDWLSGVDSDISSVQVEGSFSTKFNDNFAQLTVTPALLSGGCQFMDEAKFPTVTIKMNTENKSGTYTTASGSGFGCSGRGQGYVKIYDESGSLLHDISLENDNFYLSNGAAPYTYGVTFSVNGSQICYYQKNNYQVELEIEYWNGNTGAYLEY